MVEDEYPISMEVKRWLQAAGSEVIWPLPSIDRAFDLIEDGGFEAAVLDMNLGEGDTSHPIADKRSVPGVPFLFATRDTQVSNVSGHRHQPRLEKSLLETELVLVPTRLLN